MNLTQKAEHYENLAEQEISNKTEALAFLKCSKELLAGIDKFEKSMKIFKIFSKKNIDTITSEKPNIERNIELVKEAIIKNDFS